MVVPIVAGGAVLAFITWGEDLFGKETFNKLFKGLIVAVVLLVIYLIYKSYMLWVSAKEKVEDTYDYVTGGFEDIIDNLVETGQRGKEGLEDLYDWGTTVTPEEFLPDIDKIAGKITPERNDSLLSEIYWGPTNIITGARDITVEKAFDRHPAKPLLEKGLLAGDKYIGQPGRNLIEKAKSLKFW